MIDISLLTEAVSGGSFSGSDSYTPAMEFTGDLDESTFLTARAAVLTEAVGISEFCYQSEEILTEAVMNDLDRAVVISESAVDTVINKIKSIIDKIIAVFKGLINKIKAFFYTLTGKTDKWVKLIRPRARAASQRKEKGEVEANMHEWKVENIKKVLDSCKSETDTIKAYDIEGQAKNLESNATDKDMSDDEIDKILIRELKINCNAAGNGKAPDDLAQESMKSALNDVWEAVSGGEKTTVTIGVTKMIDEVDGAKKLKTELDKALSAAQSAYEAAKKKLNTADKKRRDSEDVKTMYDAKDEDENTKKARIANMENVLKFYKGYSRALKFKADYVTGSTQAAIKAVKTMCSEYMGAVNHFVGVRDAAVNK